MNLWCLPISILPSLSLPPILLPLSPSLLFCFISLPPSHFALSLPPSEPSLHLPASPPSLHLPASLNWERTSPSPFLSIIRAHFPSVLSTFSSLSFIGKLSSIMFTSRHWWKMWLLVKQTPRKSRWVCFVYFCFEGNCFILSCSHSWSGESLIANCPLRRKTLRRKRLYLETSRILSSFRLLNHYWVLIGTAQLLTVVQVS